MGGKSLYDHMYPENQISLQEFQFEYLLKNKVERLEFERKKKETLVHVHLGTGEKTMVVKEL